MLPFLDVIQKVPYIYGVSWDKSATTVLTRIDKSIGKTANAGVGSTPVTNDFVQAEIYKDITEVTDVSGNVFVRIPKFYIRKTDGANSKTWEIAKVKYNGFYLPACFYDFTNNVELPFIDIGKYVASLSADTTKIESKADTYPLISKTIVNFRTYAQAYGNSGNRYNGYQQMDIHAVDMLQTLFIVMFANLNSQAVMQGWTGGQYTATHLATVAETATNRIILANANANLYAVGQPISVGTSQGGNQIFYGRTITSIDVYDTSNKAISFDGAAVNIAVGNFLYNTGWESGFSSNILSKTGSLTNNSDAKSPFAFLGIENLFGSVYQFIDGININEHQGWVCRDANNYASNVFANPYEQLGYVGSSADGYIKELGFDPNLPFAELPKTAAGDSSTTYYSDYSYQSTGQRIAQFGGRWFDGSSAGLFFWFLSYTSSTSSLSLGARLLRKHL
jgi:hypothetical protein